MRNGSQHFDGWASTFDETVVVLELSPEEINYRTKARSAKLYNLSELMQVFHEVMGIQTVDMLKLLVPKVNYHNIKTKPSEIQTKMAVGLVKRAGRVRVRLVKSQQDNMLKITSDGGGLAFDQRLVDPMLPGNPESKVNACVGNIYRTWEEYADTKAVQLAFCDSSTSANRKTIEMQETRENVYEMTPDQSDNVYDDMRKKLIQHGVPAEQVRFIHEATINA